MAPRPSALTGLKIKSMLDYTTDVDRAQRGTAGPSPESGPSLSAKAVLSPASARFRR
jgi:hypothetical protein